MLTELTNKSADLATLALLLALTVLIAAVIARYFARRRQLAPLPAAPAEKDPLTGLLSRTSFERCVQQLAAQAEAEGCDVCALYASLDGFRLVNDTHGRTFGDQVLQASAKLIQSLAGQGAVLCRPGGDEFAVWLLAPRAAAEELAAKLVSAFAQPLQLQGRPVTLSLSVGLALAPEHGAGARILGLAAAAMHSVKRHGGGAHAVFESRIGAEHNEELAIARALREVLHDTAGGRGLELIYQPKIDATKLQVTAVEALLRWRHPTLGMVSPARFIPIAEKHGLMADIGRWVLESALRQAGEWHKASFSMRVAINVTGAQLRHGDFAAHLERALKTHGVPPDRLTCEVAESVAMESTEVTQRAFAQLAKLGVHVAVSEFGTGQADVAVLRRLAVRELKLDRSFVADVTRSKDAQAAVRAAVRLGHELAIRVVAEGVETQPQRDLLVYLGCDELQGHLFARPMSARAIAIWASDAATSLSQTFNPTLFKETQPLTALHTQQMQR